MWSVFVSAFVYSECLSFLSPMVWNKISMGLWCWPNMFIPEKSILLTCVRHLYWELNKFFPVSLTHLCLFEINLRYLAIVTHLSRALGQTGPSAPALGVPTARRSRRRVGPWASSIAATKLLLLSLSLDLDSGDYRASGAALGPLLRPELRRRRAGTPAHSFPFPSCCAK